MLGRELMVSFRDSNGASSLGDSNGCVTVKALESSSRELGRALRMQSRLMPYVMFPMFSFSFNTVVAFPVLGW